MDILREVIAPSCLCIITSPENNNRLQYIDSAISFLSSRYIYSAVEATQFIGIIFRRGGNWVGGKNISCMKFISGLSVLHMYKKNAQRCMKSELEKCHQNISLHNLI